MKIHLTATIGHDIRLLPKFLQYYTSLDIDNFLIILNAPETSDPTLEEAEKILSEYNIKPAMTWIGEFSEDEKVEHERQCILLNCLAKDWVLYADLDEFQVYNETLHSTADDCLSKGKAYVEGRLVDRISKDGKFVELNTEKLLDKQFPLGGYITKNVLQGWDKKIVLAQASEIVGGGHHLLMYQDIKPGRAQTQNYVEPEFEDGLIRIHHFKWDISILQRMKYALGLQSLSLKNGWHKEIKNFITYLEQHDSKIDPRDKVLEMKPVKQKLGV